MSFNRSFLWFMIYSFLGWFYESTLCSLIERKFVNRGFLNGPICPIYGFGAVLVIICLSDFSDNVGILFVLSAVLTSVLEYLTSFLIDKLFDTRLWDYTNRRFNINGRVCLEGALIFGILSVLLLKYAHPYINRLISDYINDYNMKIINTVLAVLLLADVIVTVVHVVDLKERLKEIQDAYNNFINHASLKKKFHGMEQFENSVFFSAHIKRSISGKKFQDRRLTKAFPRLSSTKYREALERLKTNINGLKQKK